MSEITRDEIEKCLIALKDPWCSAAFAARIITHVLPLLSYGVERNKLFLWFCDENERQDFLLKVFRAWQCAWCASRFKNKKISAAALVAARTANTGNGSAAAYAAQAAFFFFIQK